MQTVLYVDHTAKLSGGEIALLRLIPAVMDEVRPVVVLGEDGPLVPRLRALGVETVVLPLGSATRDLRKGRLRNPLVAIVRVASVLRYAWLLRRVIRNERVDLVHTNSLKAGFLGCLAARLAGVPSVWHLRDRVAADYLPRPAVALVRLALAVLPTHVVCNSEATARTLRADGVPRKRPRSTVIYDLLDVADTGPSAEPIMPASGARDSVPGLHIGMVGRLAPWKGQDVVIRAVGLLPPSVRLTVVGSAMFGEDDFEQLLREQVISLGLDDRVEFLGFVEDVLPVLREMDVLVHASLIPEPFGQVILEALAMGVPVVAVRGGGPSEILSEECDGLLYESGDFTALAEHLRRLQDDGELRARLRSAGLRRARDFAPAVIGPSIVRLYSRLAPSRCDPREI